MAAEVFPVEAQATLSGHAESGSHAGVFERPGGIHALMLCKELVDPQRLGCAFQFVEGGVAFAQAYRIPEIIEDGKEFAEPPDTTLIQSFARTAPLAP
jgi:hypothetical protein